MRWKQVCLSTCVALTAFSFTGASTGVATPAHAATVSFGNGNLQYGSSGQDVHVLQLALQDLRLFPASTNATSYFGSITLSAVKAFQKQNGLTVDGIVGPGTKRALMNLGYQEYWVQPGDSLWLIGQKYGESSNELLQLNHLSSTDLSVGQALLVHEHTASSGSQTGQTGQNSSLSWQVQQVVDLVNQERAKNGLQPLAVDTRLMQMAHDKAVDMRDHNYFDHQSPTYGSPFDMMKEYGISFSYAGENIAAGQKTPQEVMNAWMNSSGHRANILNPNYTKIGVGFVTGGQYGTEWVQEFIRP
jgi:uncharacterized YkwD family protein